MNSTKREIYFDNKLINDDGSVNRPRHCGCLMEDDGDCGVGCCDDYRCVRCGKRIRVEWPD